MDRLTVTRSARHEVVGGIIREANGRATARRNHVDISAPVFVPQIERQPTVRRATRPAFTPTPVNDVTQGVPSVLVGHQSLGAGYPCSESMRESGENCAFNSDRVDPITRTGARPHAPARQVMRHVFSSQLARVKARRPCSDGDRVTVRRRRWQAFSCSGCCSGTLHNAHCRLPDFDQVASWQPRVIDSAAPIAASANRRLCPGANP